LKHINGKTIYGADVVTIINKAIDNNEKNGIEKDSEDLYIKDDKKSVKVELTLLSKDEEGNSKELTYQMETLKKAGLDEFLTRFNLTTFECTSIEYNKENRVSIVHVKQLEL